MTAALVGVERAAADPGFLAFVAVYAVAAGLWAWLAVAARLLGRRRRHA